MRHNVKLQKLLNCYNAFAKFNLNKSGGSVLLYAKNGKEVIKINKRHGCKLFSLFSNNSLAKHDESCVHILLSRPFVVLLSFGATTSSFSSSSMQGDNDAACSNTSVMRSSLSPDTPPISSVAVTRTNGTSEVCGGVEKQKYFDKCSPISAYMIWALLIFSNPLNVFLSPHLYPCFVSFSLGDRTGF